MKLLTDTDYIHALIAEGEHQQQDFKFEISDARKIAKTLSAFANTDGGRLLIGVKDNGKIAGVRSEEEKYMIEAAAQLYCIPEVEYTEDDVFDRAQDELNNGTRPPLSSHIDQEVMEQYDVIFVGFPIWWYALPMPVWSFLEEYDLSGKTIIPFFTHNGSSSGASSISTVAELCPDSTVLTDDYFTYSGNNVDEAESAVDEWLTELGYNN